MKIGDRSHKLLRSTVSSGLVLRAFLGFLVPSKEMQIDMCTGRWLLRAPWFRCTRGGCPAIMAGGLVPPAIARGISSTVPSAFAMGIGPPAPLAGGPRGAIIGGHWAPSRGRGWLNGSTRRRDLRRWWVGGIDMPRGRTHGLKINI